MKNDLGKIHIYTGDGKGKTTAAFGLALRASGAGYKVYIIQFMKGQRYSELKALRSLKGVAIKQFGEKGYVHKAGSQKDKTAAKKALAFSKKIINSDKYNLVILDEIFPAVFFKLISVNDVIGLIKNKPKNVELVLTGRKASSQAVKLADYVTEMREVKHPYGEGLGARRGIES